MDTPDGRRTVTRPYAGETARNYQRLSDLGLAPAVVKVSQNEIMAELQTPLEEWLKAGRSQQEVDAMAVRIRDLLREVHVRVQICHRDVHLGNIVVNGSDEPLLIGPKWAVPAINDRCYDLDGPGPSGVQVPELHVEQGIEVWWGPDTHRALVSAFGAPPAD